MQKKKIDIQKPIKIMIVINILSSIIRHFSETWEVFI